MRKKIHEERFCIEDNNIQKQHHLVIFEPVSSEMGDSHCDVQLTPLLNRSKSIIGIDEVQAKKLAIDFVKNLLEGKRLTDINGNKIEASSLFY